MNFRISLRAATKEMTLRRMSRMAVLLSGVFLLLAARAFGQVIQIPFVSVAAGLAPGTSAAVCSGALNTIGDGCPATQASIAVAVQEVWTDSYGNVYFVDNSSSYELRVIYHGGAPLANLITINNPTVATPQVGYVYAIAGSNTRTAKYGTATFCNGTSGTVMVDVYGNGCPGYEAFVSPTGGYTDAAGDVFLADHAANSNIRVLYAGGAQAANYIYLELGISSPVVGTIYRIGGNVSGTYGYSSNGVLASATTAYLHNPHNLTMDSSGNLYIADTGNNAVREIAYSTGDLSTVAGAGCTVGSSDSCTSGYTGDNGAATSAELAAPEEVLVDANGNVYIADKTNNRVRVVYEGGNPAQAILTAEGVSSLTAGYIYTIAGGGSVAGTSTTATTLATSLALTTEETLGMDSAGNLYVGDQGGTRAIFRVNASTGIATLLALSKQSTWTTSEYCSSGTTSGTGPKATDTLGDGCPATETGLYPVTNLSFAPNGLAYFGDSQRLVRVLTFNQLFPSTAVNSSTTLPIAITSASSFTVPSISATALGTTTSDWAASAVNCTPGATGTAANTVCMYNITLTPALPGRRLGEYVLTQSGTPVLTQGLEGDGVGSLLAITPNAAATTLGSSIAAVSSVTADVLGDIYISDTTTGKLWEIASGSSTATALLTGLSSPAQSAVDGVGNVYVADTSNNRIVEYTATGSTVSLLTGLSSPKGVAVTGNGNLYVANTGANAILLYSQGITSTLPITGLSAPSALALDGSDDLFIADTGNSRVVEYANGVQSAVSFGSTTVKPVGLAVDAAGDVYVADALTDNVLRLTPGASTSISLASGLGSPSGISLDGQGDLFYADSSVAGLDEVVQQQGVASFTASGSDTLTLGNIGNAALTLTSTSPTPTGTNASAFSLAANTCTTSGLAIGGTCTETATFTSAGGGNYSASVSFATNAANTATASLSATVTVNKTTPTINAWPTASGITFGQTLSSSALTGGSASVAGSFAWTTPSSTPSTGTASYSVTFTPTDSTDYNTVTGTVSVTVAQATPVINILPTASGITFGQALSSSTLSGGTGSVSGSFAWTTPSTTPSAGTASYSVTFTPSDATDYTTTTGSVSVTVSKATPTITSSPTATSITYGQTLSSSTLSGGSGSVSGSFAWTTPTTAPATGTSSQSITFTPSDATDYNTATGTVSVTVNKATPTITSSPTATSITYGQTLASSTLSGGTGSVSGSFAFTTPTTAPGAGTASQSITFTPSDTTDYTTATGTVSVTVNKATPTITSSPTASSITYGQTLSSSTLSGGTGSVSGSFAFTTPTTAPGAGTASQGITFTPSDTTDYTTATGTVSVTVNKATPTITASPTATSITYGQTLSSSTLSGGSGSVSGGFAFTTPTTAPGAGTASQGITFTPSDTTDYNTATGTVSVNVAKAQLTVTANSFNIAFGAADPSYTYSVSGYKFSDGSGVITGSPILSTTPASPSAVGSYTINVNVSGMSAANYTFAGVNGTLTIGLATPTVTLSCTPTSVVPGQPTTCTATVSGSGATPTGTVSFAATSTGASQGTLGSATVVSGVATYYGLIWVGTDVMTATYGGDSNYGSAASNTMTLSNYSNIGKLSFNWPYINWGQAVSYGASSGAWPVTVQNLTGATVNTPTITSSNANFVVTAGSCNGVGTLAVGANCSFSVVFTPTTGGSPSGTKITGTLTASTTTSAGYSNTLAESGIAMSSSLSFNWPFLNFTPTVAVGVTSSDWPVTLTNQSGTSTTLANPVATFTDASFAIDSAADGCSGVTLAPGGSCTYSVNFTPLAADITHSGTNVIGGTMTATGNSGGISGTLNVGGWGGAALGFNWPFLTFQGVAQGATGANPWPVTVTNYSGSALTGLNFAFTGQSNYVSGAFVVTDPNNCFGNTLAAGASCLFNVLPTPQSSQSIGAYSATLVVSGTSGAAALSSYSLSVSGVANVGGLAINWNQDQQNGTSTIDFGPQNTANVTAGPWPITVYNNTPSVQTLTVTPSLSQFTTDVSTLTNVPSGGSAVFNLYFTPTAVTSYQGTLTVTGTGCTYTFNTWGSAHN